LIVKQYYSSRCEEKACENFKNLNPHILKEKSRMIKSDGSVIKFLNNNNIEVSLIKIILNIKSVFGFNFENTNRFTIQMVQFIVDMKS
jgi:hypothetical protein